MEEEKPKRSPKKFAADTALAIGDIWKAMDVIPILEQFDWFDKKTFKQSGSIQIIQYYARKYNMTVNHLLKVMNETDRYKDQPLPELPPLPALQRILDAFPDLDVLKAEGLDEAVIGIVIATTKPRLVYSVEKCIEVLMDRDGFSYGDAVDFLYFNTFDAYVGEQTPIWYSDTELEAPEVNDPDDNLPDYEPIE